MSEKKDCPKLDDERRESLAKPTSGTINEALESCEKLHGLYLRQEEILQKLEEGIQKQKEETRTKFKELAKQKQQLTKLKENTSAN